MAGSRWGYSAGHGEWIRFHDGLRLTVRGPLPWGGSPDRFLGEARGASSPGRPGESLFVTYRHTAAEAKRAVDRFVETARIASGRARTGKVAVGDTVGRPSLRQQRWDLVHEAARRGHPVLYARGYVLFGDPPRVTK